MKYSSYYLLTIYQSKAPYISYCPVAVIKYDDQKSLRGERAYFGLWFQRDRVHHGGEAMATVKEIGS